LAWNRRLREHIDSLRRERIVFDTVYKKHDKELAEQKKAMADIIEMSNSAYEARCAQMNRLFSRFFVDQEIVRPPH
jgi:hypothetical protein